jgi:hypothetical protein
MDTVKRLHKRATSTLGGLPGPVRAAVYVVGAVAVLALVSRLVTSRSGGGYPRQLVRRVRGLVRESAQWTEQSRQSDNALLSVVHATNAVAALRVAKSLTTGADLGDIADVPVSEFEEYVEDAQAAAIRRVVAACPALKPSGSFAVVSGWAS